MGEHAKIRNIPDLLSWAAYEDIDECLFKEGSQTILSIVRAFKYESKLESSLSIYLDGLSYDDYIVFIKELIKEIELTQKVIDHFDRSDQAERVSRFTAFLLSSLRGMAESLLRLKKWKDAITVLKEALNLKPNDSDIVALLGRAYLEDENLEKSKTISQTDKVIKDRGRAIERESSPTGADSSAKVKEESEDEFLKGKLSEAKELIGKAKPSEAIQCLEEALIVKPDDVKCITTLGVVYSLIHEFEKAEENLTKAHELNPYDIEILKNIVTVFYQLRKRKKVIDILEEANRRLPHMQDVLALLGEAYLLDDQDHKAKDFLEEACILDSGDISSLNNLGQVYISLEKYNKAISVLEKARRLNPDNIAVLNNLGKVYLIIKAYVDAKEVLEKAYSIDSQNVAVLLNLGMTFYYLEERGKAKNFLEEANRLAPSNAAISNMLAFYYHESGDVYKARHYIELAYKLRPDVKEIQYNRDIVLGKSEGKQLLIPSLN